MGRRLDAFLKGSTKQMQLGFIGFLIGLAGVAFGFSIDYNPGNPLVYIAFGIVVLGVTIVFVAIAWANMLMIKDILNKSKRN
jgi:hypothetical protein